MGDAFTFRWGPGRLAGLGINLSPDQAACTQTTGKALVVYPEIEPHPKYGWWPLRHPDLGWLVRPAVIDVVLNDEIQVPTATFDKVSGNLLEEGFKPMMRQDFLDKQEGEDWRKYARMVASYGWMSPTEDIVNDDTSVPLWSGVMIDDSNAGRILEAAEKAFNATDLPMWDEYRRLTSEGCECFMNGEDCSHWEIVADYFQIEDPGSLEEHGWFGDSEPDWVWERCVPDYAYFMTDEDRGIWERLVDSARTNWATYLNLIGRQPSTYKSYFDISTNPF